MLRSLSFILRITVSLCLFTLGVGTNAAVAQDEITVSGGSEGGGYNTFLKLLNDNLAGLNIKALVSKGSSANIDRVNKKEAPFALVQNDVGNYSYYGLKGQRLQNEFGAVLPVLQEYVQILARKDRGITDIFSLKGKRVAIGEEGSGSYLNAIDIFDQAHLDTAKDIDLVYYGSGPGQKALEAGEIDALILTSRPRAYDASADVGHVEIPLSIVNGLSNAHPYYSAVMPPASLKTRGYVNDQMLSVTTYIIAGTDTSPKDIETLIKEMIGGWDRLKAMAPDMVELDVALQKRPFPFHPAAQKVLEELEYFSSPINLFLIISLAAIAVGLAVYVSKNRSSYNRLGVISHVNGGAFQRIIDFIAPFGVLIGISALIMLVLSLIIYSLQLFEADYARLAGIEDKFSNRTLGESLIWMFTFMVSGYPDVIYPASPAARIALAFVGMAGVALPLWITYQLFDLWKVRRSRRERGEGSFWGLENHVLICGWNNKVPVLIYALTGDDAPSKKSIVVISEMEEERPLAKWNFDKNLVHYCRGNSADHEILARANSDLAVAAIIVDDEQKSASNNLGSALTALALKDSNDKILTISELVRSSNKTHFEATEVDCVVDGSLISERMLALACYNSNIADFVMDSMTYDGYSEFYSISTGAMIKAFKFKNRKCETYGDLISAAHDRGLNILGIDERAQERVSGLLQADFNRHSNLNIFLDQASYDQPINEDHMIVYIADDDVAQGVKKIKSETNRKGEFHKEAIFAGRSGPTRFLVIGDKLRANNVEDELQGAFNCDVYDVICPTNLLGDEMAINDAILAQLQSQTYECIIIMNTATGLEALSQDKAYLGDAQVILETKLVRKVVEDTAMHNVKIVTELNLAKNRKLLQGAGATAIVPTGMLVQRFLAKPIWCRGYVSDMIVALMSLRDGVHFRSLTLQSDHVLVGRPFNQVINMVFDDGRIIAALPMEHVDSLKNSDGDFETHFVMAPNEEYRDTVLKVGDVIVALYHNKNL